MGVRVTGPSLETGVFSWTGANSELERRKAAEELGRYIASLEEDQQVKRWHLIAHSHGGNVARRAIRDLRIPLRKQGQCVLLGTPLFSFKDEGKVRNFLLRINVPAAVTLLAATWFVALFIFTALMSNISLQSWVRPGLMGLSVVATLIIILNRYYERTWSPIRHVRAVNLIFSSDEAIGLLRKCGRVVTDTHILLHQIFAGAEDHLGAKERALSAAAKFPVIGSLMELLGIICLLFGFRPYRPAFRMFFSSRFQPLKQSFAFLTNEDFSDVGSDLPPGYTAIAVMLAPLLARIPYVLIVLPLDILIGLVDWLFQVGARLSIWLGLRMAAKTAFGIDILGSAFQYEAVAQAGDGISQIELAPALEDLAIDRMAHRDRTRRNLAEILRTDDVGALTQAVKRSLIDTDLLHAQYYQDQGVINSIADLIKSFPSEPDSPSEPDYARIRELLSLLTPAEISDRPDDQP